MEVRVALRHGVGSLMGRVRPRGGRLGLMAVVLIVGAVLAAVTVVHGGSGRSRGAPARAAISGGGVSVRWRNLVATDTESGTLSYADPQTVYNRLPGTVTWLPRPGQEIRPGGVLYRVDNAPVLLLSGATPAYRVLSGADVSGPDVRELNVNLERLGFAGAGLSDDVEWQAATTIGVERLQQKLGEEVTGALALGQVVFLPGPQLVASTGTSVGSSAGGGPILQTTSARLVVTVDLDANAQREAAVGGRVTVEMPAGNVIAGRITAVSRIARSSPGGGGGSGQGGGGGATSAVPVTIAFSGHHRSAGLDQAAVSVNFVSERARHVLSVPVTALVATPGGHYALQEAAPPHTLIAVNPGLFAAGEVQVSGPGVHPGLEVTNSEG